MTAVDKSFWVMIGLFVVHLLLRVIVFADSANKFFHKSRDSPVERPSHSECSSYLHDELPVWQHKDRLAQHEGQRNSRLE